MRELLAGLISKCFQEMTLNLGPTGTLINRENKSVGRTVQIEGTPRGKQTSDITRKIPFVISFVPFDQAGSSQVLSKGALSHKCYESLPC